MPVTILFRDADGASLQLDVLSRSHPGTTDYWDGNWLETDIEISTPVGRHKYTADLRSDEFARFLNGLRNVEHDLTGAAILPSMEDWIEIKIRGEGTGTFLAECEASWSQLDDESSISHSFYLRRGDVSRIRSSVESVLKEFPVLGRPDA